MLQDLDASSKRSWTQQPDYNVSGTFFRIALVVFLTPAGTRTPLNVAPPAGTTRGNLVITPNDNLVLSAILCKTNCHQSSP